MQNQEPRQSYYPPQGQQGYYQPQGQQPYYPPQGQQPMQSPEPAYYQPGEKIDWFALPKAYALNMKRQEKYKWYKPILAAVIGVVLWIIFVLVVFGVGFYLQSIIEPDISVDPMALIRSGKYMDPTRPLLFLTALLAFAVFIPAVMIAMKITGLSGIGTFSSVLGRLRWDRIRGFVGWLILVMLVGSAVDIGYSVFHYGADVALAGFRFLPLALIVAIIFAPLQSAAEEYAFRGFLMQTFSGWLPLVFIPLVPLIVQAVLFGSLHTQYNILGLIVTGWMGLVAGYVTIKTGGLECAICIHAVNNAISMVATILIVSLAPDEVTIGAFIIAILLNAAFGLVSLWVSKRKGWILK